MPFIDVADNGGSAVEFNQTLQGAVSTIKNVDTVVGGHTPSPVTWTDFTTYTDFYKDFLTAAQDNMKKGTSVDDFVKAYRVPEKYKGFQADPRAGQCKRAGDLGREQEMRVAVGRCRCRSAA